MIRFSISWDKFHFDIPIRPADKRDGHSNGLVVVLRSDFSHQVDGEHIELLRFRKVPLVFHGEEVPVGDHRLAGDLVAAC